MTAFDEFFKKSGIRVKISSRQFELTCMEYVKEHGLMSNCSEIVRKHWPNYHANRSMTTLFYGKSQVN